MLLATIIADSWSVAQADAVLHFGTHGSLEFMPGKQVGMSDLCYPDSLISSIPNIYYYAANNPSEATIAKRRSYANTISYLTPPAENAGLYKGLKVSLCLCYGVTARVLLTRYCLYTTVKFDVFSDLPNVCLSSCLCGKLAFLFLHSKQAFGLHFHHADIPGTVWLVIRLQGTRLQGTVRFTA